jgi:hypothetical protein
MGRDKSTALGRTFQLAQCSYNEQAMSTNRSESGISRFLVEAKRRIVEEHDQRLSIGYMHGTWRQSPETDMAGSS